MQAAQFWTQLKEHRLELADSHMKKEIQSGMKHFEEKRLRIWTSRSFKVKVLKTVIKMDTPFTELIDDVIKINVERINHRLMIQ